MKATVTPKARVKSTVPALFSKTRATKGEVRELRNLLHAWLHYCPADPNSAEAFYKLRYRTVQLIGAHAKLIVSRNPDLSRVKVSDLL